MPTKYLKPIKGYDAFRKVYESGKKFFSGSATATVCFKPCDRITIRKLAGFDPETTFFGVTINRKIAKKAVTRNRIKRLLRECIRICYSDLYRNEAECPFKYIIITWKSPVAHPMMVRLAEMLEQVRALLLKADDYYHSKYI